MSIPRKADSVRINEVTPRDGLQNIGNFIPTREKLRLLDLLVASGARYLESTAFVSPRWVPQLSDASEVLAYSLSFSGVECSVLVPNMKGFELARQSGAREIVTVLSASEIHNRSNVNKSVDESLDECVTIGMQATEVGVKVRCNIATTFGYLPEEEITADRIISIAAKLEDAGYSGITLCDTTGVAAPDQVHSLCSALLKNLRQATLAIHLHQCSGIEFANAYAAFDAGVRIYDAAAGGLGGCPFAADADGNIPTETLVAMFGKMGVECGIDQADILEVSCFARTLQAEYSTREDSTENRLVEERDILTGASDEA